MSAPEAGRKDGNSSGKKSGTTQQQAKPRGKGGRGGKGGKT